jgi:hypothetical protein
MANVHKNKLTPQLPLSEAEMDKLLSTQSEESIKQLLKEVFQKAY